VEERLGTGGMVAFIGTEAALFAMLFFSYYFLSVTDPQWPRADPPKLGLAIAMLAVLLGSSAVLEWGQRGLERGRRRRARLATGCTVFLGLVFIALQVLEYRDHLRTLTPWQSAYGSIFYTMTSFHALHVMLGLLMLGYALVLPRWAAPHAPHRPLHNAALYWHFVDAVWVALVAVLYVAPHVR
jgi:heme/copper-type cytochrome/quinol oxidase subunit 3